MVLRRDDFLSGGGSGIRICEGYEESDTPIPIITYSTQRHHVTPARLRLKASSN
jgi:hypothetical protein